MEWIEAQDEKGRKTLIRVSEIASVKMLKEEYSKPERCVFRLKSGHQETLLIRYDDKLCEALKNES